MKAHNKNKQYLKGLGYVSKNYQRDAVLGYVRALSITIGLTLGMWIAGDLSKQVELVSPMGAEPVFATYVEPVIDPCEDLGEIEAYICEVFGDEYENAYKIAHCESKLRAGVVGDTHIMMLDEKWGEMVGDSIGVFQIRTGGKGWNRARANGMSADEFRVKLKDYKYNVDYAKTIFDRQEWYPWTCKKDL